MTIPNFISIIRIILTPIFIIYLINDEFFSALVVFILAGLTDAADGLIARLFDQKSELGVYLDPLADKILLIAAFITLSVLELIPSWLTVVVITRDILILLGVLIFLLNKTDFTMKPFFLSKITTCLQLGSVFLVLSKDYFPLFFKINDPVFWVTGFFTITSGLLYLRYWVRRADEGPIGGGI